MSGIKNPDVRHMVKRSVHNADSPELKITF